MKVREVFERSIFGCAHVGTFCPGPERHMKCAVHLNRLRSISVLSIAYSAAFSNCTPTNKRLSD